MTCSKRGQNTEGGKEVPLEELQEKVLPDRIWAELSIAQTCSDGTWAGLSIAQMRSVAHHVYKPSHYPRELLQFLVSIFITIFIVTTIYYPHYSLTSLGLTIWITNTYSTLAIAIEDWTDWCYPILTHLKVYKLSTHLELRLVNN